VVNLSTTPTELAGLRAADAGIHFAESALATSGGVMSTGEFQSWLAERRDSGSFAVRRIPFAAMTGWHFQPDTGNLVHDSGRFFTVEGMRVRTDQGPAREWSQPIMNQPEIGILGIVVKQIDGVLHFLMQIKPEPGSVNTYQLTTTVQATRSNYTRAHQGRPTPYLEYFVERGRSKVHVDVLQSEQNAWCFRKRNRNMVVEVTDDVPLRENFCWLTLGQLHQLLSVDDLVNMNARTVLSCIPFTATGWSAGRDPFLDALVRSMGGRDGSWHTTGDTVSWYTDAKGRHDVTAGLIPLDWVSRWQRHDDRIAHEDERFFQVIATEVEAGSREVGRWCQPLIEPIGRGIVAFLAKRLGGVLHLLVHARVDPGCHDVVQLAPTVQCVPESYRGDLASGRPLFLDTVLEADPAQVRYRTVLSEEGGRYYHARSEYSIVEVGDEFPIAVPPDYRWMTVEQLAFLQSCSYYVNIQARTLVACLRSLC
jgi:oxidase EvaA